MRFVRRVLSATTAAVTLAAIALPAGAVAASDATARGVTAAVPQVTHHVIASFDGTPIEATLFLPATASPAAPVPLVLRTHGWAGSRETQPDGTLGRLVDEGYAVLTWDSRGFGCSGGETRIDDPEVEGRDVSRLIDWALANAPIATDRTGDPVVGMTGGSYAGGIQLSAASVDDRIDALAPEIAWHDLRYSLYSGEVVNQGWVALLYGAGTATGTALGLDPNCRAQTAAAMDPAIHRGVSEFTTTGGVSAETLDFFAKSSLGSFGERHPVTVPTLVVQGSVDTLFDLTDGYRIFRHVADRGVDARFVAFCGGHVACPSSYVDADDRAYLDDALVAWFARHLRGQHVDTGAPVSYRTNEGVWRDVADFAGTAALPLDGEAAQLPVVPVVDVPEVDDVVGLVADLPPGGIPALPFTAARPASDGDPRAARFEVARAGDFELVGIPRVRLEVSGTHVPLETALAPLGDLARELPVRRTGDLLVGTAGPLGSATGGLVGGAGGDDGALGGVDGAVHVFVKLIHRERGEVVNLQEGAVRVPLSATGVTVDVPMPGMAYTIPAGDHLDVEVSTASLLHTTGRTPALIDVRLTGVVPTTPPAVDEAADDRRPGRPALPRPPIRR
ncbi:alpha/beta hydrolase family protein [Egicoccus sp. AB-alg6-2]|uniref:alpha/beta hydrolase family protein n=1 Tax=Egicoccus sp. AB-alg6-2 TaxID=3242692 RepID=UPI00359CF9DF